MNFMVVLGDTGFLGAAFSSHLINEGADFLGLNRERMVLVKGGIRQEFPRKSSDLFKEIEPFLSEDCTVINTIWGSNNREFRDSIVQEENSFREISLIDKLEDSNTQYVSFGSIAEISNKEISPSCNTEYARAKMLIAERLLGSKLNYLWIRVASSYGQNDRRDWLIPQLLQNWRIKEELFLENPGQLINLCYLDSLVGSSLKIIHERRQGIFNATTIQWMTVEDIKNCFKSLQEPEYLVRTAGPFSPTDPNKLLISSPPVTKYFAEFQENYKS
jgi:nucleoside-diphosphate-sugar epimerase